MPEELETTGGPVDTPRQAAPARRRPAPKKPKARTWADLTPAEQEARRRKIREGMKKSKAKLGRPTKAAKAPAKAPGRPVEALAASPRPGDHRKALAELQRRLDGRERLQRDTAANEARIRELTAALARA